MNLKIKHAQMAEPTDPAATASARAPQAARQPLAGLDRGELGAFLGRLGVAEKAAPMRANQIWNWLYARGARDFGAMTTLSKDLREALAQRASLRRPEIMRERQSSDGTRKWLLRLDPEEAGRKPAEIETVYIPEEDRGTLCISSQVGCTLTCSFCHTGTQRLVRNLSAGEILAQILVARDALGEWPHASPTPDRAGAPRRRITNVVVMGMGEPLYNFDNVKKALLIASDDAGLAISKRRITLSTSGVVPMMRRCGEEIGVMLAVSLHGVRDEVRDRLVPINRKFPIARLMEACRTYPRVSNTRRITFEYVMLRDINDTADDARALVGLLAGIPAKINLIPFNPWPGSPYECSPWERIERFAEIVNRAGYASPIRAPRGRDIMAACGQLKSRSRRVRAPEAAPGEPDARNPVRGQRLNPARR